MREVVRDLVDVQHRVDPDHEHPVLARQVLHRRDPRVAGRQRRREPHVDALGVHVEPRERHVVLQQISPPIRPNGVSTTRSVEPSPMPQIVRSDPVGTSLRCFSTIGPSGARYSNVL